MKTLLLFVTAFSNPALTCTSHDKPDTAPLPHQHIHALAATIAETEKAKQPSPKSPTPAPKPAPKERDPKQARPNYLLM